MFLPLNQGNSLVNVSLRLLVLTKVFIKLCEKLANPNILLPIVLKLEVSTEPIFEYPESIAAVDNIAFLDTSA